MSNDPVSPVEALAKYAEKEGPQKVYENSADLPRRQFYVDVHESYNDTFGSVDVVVLYGPMIPMEAQFDLYHGDEVFDEGFGWKFSVFGDASGIVKEPGIRDILDGGVLVASVDDFIKLLLDNGFVNMTNADPTSAEQRKEDAAVASRLATILRKEGFEVEENGRGGITLLTEDPEEIERAHAIVAQRMHVDPPME
jgi:hypothetical protein